MTKVETIVKMVTPFYGGYPYWSCHIHLAHNGRGTFYAQDNKFYIKISDTWDSRLVTAVKGTAYPHGYSKSPVGHIWISRELLMALHSHVQISSNILEAEKTLQDQLPEGPTTTTLSS
jgi:hypothetical protein